MVTRLKDWTEFFEKEEFQQCSAKMNGKPDKKKPKSTMAKQSQISDHQDDSGSDSEPSVDNFDLTELEENLGAALDPNDQVTSPFLMPIQELIESHVSMETEENEIYLDVDGPK